MRDKEGHRGAGAERSDLRVQGWAVCAVGGGGCDGGHSTE